MYSVKRIRGDLFYAKLDRMVKQDLHTVDGIIKSPQGTLGKLLCLYIFLVFFMYFLIFLSNIKVFGQNNVIFELLRQK